MYAVKTSKPLSHPYRLDGMLLFVVVVVFLLGTDYVSTDCVYVKFIGCNFKVCITSMFLTIILIKFHTEYVLKLSW
jgi:hypothetical protein